ncbi:hypothetical protein T439DRAFT_324335 [Meredithblackwellia eburnea MCA 4105]
MSNPSVFLPQISRKSAKYELQLGLDNLEPLILQHHSIIDLSLASSGTLRPNERELQEIVLDQFERDFAGGWIQRLISWCLKKQAEGEEAEDLDDMVQRASAMLSASAGESAAGPTTTTFVFPSPAVERSAQSNEHPSLQKIETFQITLRSTTLLSSSTGFRTWGSAPLLSRLLASNPTSFFRPITSSPPSSKISASPLKVLELGSGTGLVGITAAKLLALSGIVSTVVLTDFDPNVLDNLRHNLATNLIPEDVGNAQVGVEVEKLDWRDFSPSCVHHSLRTSPKSARFGIILAADVMYEPELVPLVLGTVSELLEIPSTGNAGGGSFHLVHPLRPTHSLELETFFAALRGELQSNYVPQSTAFDGINWKLAILEKMEIEGQDFGFGQKGEKRDMNYLVCRIGWTNA